MALEPALKIQDWKMRDHNCATCCFLLVFDFYRATHVQCICIARYML